MIRASITGIGLAAPGLADWDAARRVLTGEAVYVHAPLVLRPVQALPPAERRRAGPLIRLSIAVAQEAVAQAGVDVTTLASVFASADGDSENLHQICLALASDAPEISPTRFHNSVQNAPSGYWSIAMQSRAPTTTLNGLDTVFATALVEAATQATAEARDVLVIACDFPMPPPLHALHPLPDGAAVALVLAPGDASNSLAALDLALVPSSDAPATALREPGLDALRLSNPALRALPLLCSVARTEDATMVLDLDDVQALQVRIRAGRAR